MCWRAEPDGYTLLVNALADVQNLHYLPVPYDAVNDFALIGKITDGPPLVLIVNAALPYKSLAELIADAKANPSKISFGTSGPATSPAIALTQLNALAGTKIVDVPYRGSGAGGRRGRDRRGPGRLHVLFQRQAARGRRQGARARGRQPAADGRLARGPDHGGAGLPGFDHRGFVGLAAPGKTPAPIVAFLNKHLNEAINSDLFRPRMEALGMTIPSRQHAGEIRRVHAPRERAAGRACASSPAMRR